MNYLDVANSPLMFTLCAFTICFVLAQAALFLKAGWERGIEMGLKKSVMKKAMMNSALFSVIPSLPIIIMLMVLSVPLGRYFPWLRLSVVGSASYESMAADATAKAAGLAGMTDPGFSLPIFATAIWVMTMGIVWGIIFNIFFMRSLDKFSKRAKSSNNQFVPIFSAALFMGMISLMAAPYAVNTTKINGIVSIVTSGIAVLICGYIAKVTKISAISEFSLPISMICGMISAIIYTHAII